MRAGITGNRLALLAVTMVLVGLDGGRAEAQWPQWGGPNGNFTIETKGLADTWPEDGPRKLWRRELGDGYSTIAVDDGVLFTMYRVGDDEFSIALDAKTGKTLWQHKQASPVADILTSYGPGPHATPLVCGDHVYTAGSRAMLLCLSKKTGKVTWSCDMLDKFKVPVPKFGYACSPIPWGETVILPVYCQPFDTTAGGSATSRKAAPPMLAAFNQTSGKVAWQCPGPRVDYSTPSLIEFGGKEQLVVHGADQVLAVDPSSGRHLWSVSYPPPHGDSYASPLRVGDDLLLTTIASKASRMLRLLSDHGNAAAEVSWTSRKMRIHLGNAVRVGSQIVGTSGGGDSAAVLVGLDAKTGKRLWAKRGFGGAMCIGTDGKLILLDENGYLALLTVDESGPTIHAKCKISEYQSWAAPTLVGRTLYLRDRKQIMALDLG
jgi:outer membrane protein assembly factor BamB